MRIYEKWASEAHFFFSKQTMPIVDVKKLEALATPIVADLGYDLVDLEWRREPAGWVLRLFIDRPDPGDLAKLDPPLAGVSLEDCSRVSHALSAELDVADLIHVTYQLEVSSPGLDRPLRREADFRRFIGRRAKIRSRHTYGEGAVPRRNFNGTLQGVVDGKVSIDVDGQIFHIPVDDIDKANLEYET